MSTAFLVKLLGLLAGVLARTILPWLRKVRDGRVRGFKPRYLYSALAALAIGLILTLILFPKFDAEAEGATFEAFFKLFGLAFAFGFGWNALINEGGAWVAGPEDGGPAPGGRPGTAAG
jgi:H+/Cl- antiporter ClcA